MIAIICRMFHRWIQYIPTALIYFIFNTIVLSTIERNKKEIQMILHVAYKPMVHNSVTFYLIEIVCERMISSECGKSERKKRN